MLPTGHRLAGKDVIGIADLAGEHPPPGPRRRSRMARHRHRASRAGKPPPRSGLPRREEKLEHVAAGHGVVSAWPGTAPAVTP
nr:hypothetical protein [Microbispora rosea]